MNHDINNYEKIKTMSVLNTITLWWNSSGVVYKYLELVILNINDINNDKYNKKNIFLMGTPNDK